MTTQFSLKWPVGKPISLYAQSQLLRCLGFQRPVVSSWMIICCYNALYDDYDYRKPYFFLLKNFIIPTKLAEFLSKMHFSKTLELQVWENSSTTSHSLECTEKLHCHSQVYKTGKNFRKHQSVWLHYKRQGYENFGRFYPRPCKCCMYLKDVWVLSTITPLGIQASVTVVYFWSGASSVDKSGVLWWRKL